MLKTMEDLFVCVFILENLIASCQNKFVKFALQEAKVDLLTSFEICYKLEVIKNGKN